MDRDGCFCRLLPHPTRAFPVIQAGRRPSLHFRGLLGLHSRCGLPDCSTAQRRPLSRGFDPAGCPTVPLVSYRILPTTLRVAPSSTGEPRRWGARRVEDGRSGLGHPASPCFPSPLIKPDVPISGIRLSDWLHLAAVGGAPMCTRRSRSTPSFSKTTLSEKRRVPRVGTLCRRVRNPRTAARTWLSTAR